jgi:amino acid transporter
MSSAPSVHLDRNLRLRTALSANIVTMVGCGPFITIPLLLKTMGGPQAMLGWILGAVIAMCDGLAWAELGSALPHSGGGYRYVLESFGARGLGRLMSFLVLWQAVIVIPLIIASGAVAFSSYALYLYPAMSAALSTLLAIGVCLLSTALLYRRIVSVGRWSMVFNVVVFGAALWVVVEGIVHASVRSLELPPEAFESSRAFWIGLGGATLYATYDYSGYQTACYIGGEVADAERTIPRAVVLSILIVCTLYIAMSLSIVGVLPWQQAMGSRFVVSDFIARLHTRQLAALMTALILVISFSSVFANMLGASRIPYAAAEKGQFFKVFARLHPRGHFPSFAVLYVGAASAICCLWQIDQLIQAAIVISVLTLAIPTVLAVVLLRIRRPNAAAFRMHLYPVPVVVALAGWLYIIATSGAGYALIGFGVLTLGMVAYLARARATRDWPWRPATDDRRQGRF